MSNQFIICCFETNNLENIEPIYNYTRPISNKLRIHYSDDEQIQMLLGIFDKFEDAFDE